MELTREQRNEARKFFMDNELPPPYDHELDRLAEILAHRGDGDERVPAMNYMRRVGKSSCIRCEFETDEAQSFAEQDAALMAHLAEKHPNWMTEPLTAEQQKALVERCMDPKDKRTKGE
jgi:hypothetical protein